MDEKEKQSDTYYLATYSLIVLVQFTPHPYYADTIAVLSRIVTLLLSSTLTLEKIRRDASEIYRVG